MDSAVGDAHDAPPKAGRLRSSRNKQASLPEQVRAIREKEQKQKKKKGGNRDEKHNDGPHSCSLSGESLEAVKKIVDEGILKVLTQMNQRTECFEKRADILETEIFEKDKEVKRMEAQLIEQEKTIKALNEQMESIETNRRMNTLILKCKEFGERRMSEDIEADTVRIINTRFPDLQVGVADFQTIHRLQGEHTVICKFVKTKLRNELFDRRLSLRGARGADRQMAPLYVNESLSPKRQEVLNALLEEKRQKRIYTVFSKRGVVYFKETPESRGRRVDDISHLRSMLGCSAAARKSSSTTPAGGAATRLEPGSAPVQPDVGRPGPAQAAAGPGAVARDPAVAGRQALRDGSSRPGAADGRECAPPVAEAGRCATTGAAAANQLGCPGPGPGAASATSTARTTGEDGADRADGTDRAGRADRAPPGDRSLTDSSVTVEPLGPDDPPAGDPLVSRRLERGTEELSERIAEPVRKE